MLGCGQSSTPAGGTRADETTSSVARDDPAAARDREEAQRQPEPAPRAVEQQPAIAQVALEDFGALPAMSSDGLRIAVPVKGGFSGFSEYAHVLILDVARSEVVERYRAVDRSGASMTQIPQLNVLLEAGGFRRMAAIAEIGYADSTEIDEESGFAGTITLHDPVDYEAPTTRGALFEGAQRFSVALREADGAHEYRLPNLSYLPPEFRRVPRNCRASFMPGMTTVWGRTGADVLLVKEEWTSGSGECFPWRLVVVYSAEGSDESQTFVIEENDL